MGKLKRILLLPLIVIVIAAFLYVGWRAVKLSSGLNQTSEQSTHQSEPVATAVSVAALGDIASCESENDTAVAALLSNFDGRILTLGDNVYPDGTAEQFAECFDPLFGSVKNNIYPSPGNHDYQTKDAAGYFGYFGGRAGEDGYYKFRYGDWELYSLNSNCGQVGCQSDSEQLLWLKAELATSTVACQLAYYHHPRFSSGIVHGDNTSVDAIWRTLVESGVDVALSGHEHFYERFGRLDSNGNTSEAGVRQFIAGSGGRSLYKFADIRPGSEVRDNQNYGMLMMSLTAEGYSWQFLDVKRKVLDSGSDSCR